MENSTVAIGDSIPLGSLRGPNSKLAASWTATPCDQEQHVTAVAASSQGCFKLGRHVPLDGERAVEVEGHDAAVHNQSARSRLRFRLGKDSRFRPPLS